jgi:hypothetical protein
MEGTPPGLCPEDRFRCEGLTAAPAIALEQARDRIRRIADCRNKHPPGANPACALVQIDCADQPRAFHRRAPLSCCQSWHSGPGSKKTAGRAHASFDPCCAQVNRRSACHPMSEHFLSSI